MYELTIDTVFSAAHAIVVAGRREPVHGHDWRVSACIAGETLDEDGLLIDFHAVEQSLNAVVGPFRNANLNEIAPFTTTNPTAENVAAHIAAALAERLPPLVADHPTYPARRVGVAWVRVTEAPGCTATYRST